MIGLTRNDDPYIQSRKSCYPQIIQKHLNNPIPNPNELRKNLPAWLGPAIQKLMSKSPDERFQTAKETYLYFRKMRAEDQLRLKSGSGGRAIDLGGESSMLVVKEERHSTQTLRAQRSTFMKMPTQPTIVNSLMPKLNTGNTEETKPAEEETTGETVAEDEAPDATTEATEPTAETTEPSAETSGPTHGSFSTDCEAPGCPEAAQTLVSTQLGSPASPSTSKPWLEGLGMGLSPCPCTQLDNSVTLYWVLHLLLPWLLPTRNFKFSSCSSSLPSP